MTAPRHDAWTDYECSLLQGVVGDLDWFEQISHLLVGRSEAAIRAKMCALRREAGIVPAHAGPRAVAATIAHRQRAEHASAKLLRALEEAAA